MCNPACIDFARTTLYEHEVKDREVLEVGSLQINGSVRAYVQSLGPKNYVGIDLVAGPGVDEICNAVNICDRFGKSAFDVIITTEMLEHVRDWQYVTSSLKQVLRPGGVLILTTRSYGFCYHGFPEDYWRYELGDMKQIWDDFQLESLMSDPLEPGVFVKARKPQSWVEKDLGDYSLYSIIKRRRVPFVTTLDVVMFRIQYVTKMVLSDIKRVPGGAIRRTRRMLNL